MYSPNVAREVSIRAVEVEWHLGLVPRLEDVDILQLTEQELLPHVDAMRIETRWLRQLLHEALTCISTLKGQLRRATETIIEQRRQLQLRRSA